MEGEKPRVLVLSAAVGAGHMRAAQAVELWLKRLAPGAVVLNVDVLALANAAFRRVYRQSYLELVTRAPHLVGYLYELSDKGNPRGAMVDRLHRMVQRLNLGKVIAMLKKEPWDIAVSTHFLPPDIIAGLRRSGASTLPHATVVTDLDSHGMWVHRPCERYFVATPGAVLSLENWGVPRSDIAISGIPIHPVFSERPDAAECRVKHGLRAEGPVVLVLAGGLGLGPIERVFTELLGIDQPVQIIVVTGKNARLKGQLERITPPARHAVVIFGYTHDMDELLAVADVVVSKPGGLTTSEVLARGAALAIVDPIPGQESRNSDFLLENGAAVKINSLASLRHKVEGLLADPERLGRMRARARSLARPDAGRIVASELLEMIGAEVGFGAGA